MNDIEKIKTEKIAAQVKDIISEVLNVPRDKLTDSARFREDLDAESLDLISLISELEDQFEQDVTDDDAMALQTVGDAIKFVESAMGKES